MPTNNLWNNQIAAANSNITLNSGTHNINISTDAAATVVAVATGGAAKTLTLGSTNTTSSTVIKSGSGNIAMNSGLTVNSSGINTNSAQPAFFVYKGSNTTNATGDGTVYQISYDTVSFDQGSHFNTGSHYYVAPVAGIYWFYGSVNLGNVPTAATNIQFTFVKNGSGLQNAFDMAGLNPSPTGYIVGGGALVSMSVNDTMGMEIQIGGTTKTVTVVGGGVSTTTFMGYLVC